MDCRTANGDAMNPSDLRRACRYVKRGFTLIEMLVVMAIIATLLTLAAPRYFGSLDRANEAVLKENLKAMRDTLDKFYADQGRFPSNLDELAEMRYFRGVPVDPITESNQTWISVSHPDADKQGIADIKSGAPGNARDGSAYADW